MSERDPHFAVPASVANAVMRYLNSRPHGEVRNIIDALSACKLIEDDDDRD